MLGRCGVSAVDLKRLKISQLFNKIDGFFDFQQDQERNEWERVRWLALATIQPQIKKRLKLQDLIVFDWEKPKIKKNPQMTTDEALKLVAKLDKMKPKK